MTPIQIILIILAICIILVIGKLAYNWICICFGITDELKQWVNNIRSRTNKK